MQPGIIYQTNSIVDDDFQQSAVNATHEGLRLILVLSRASGSKTVFLWLIAVASLGRTRCGWQAEIGKLGTLPGRYLEAPD